MSIFSWLKFINFWSLHNTTILETFSSFVNKNRSCDNCDNNNNLLSLKRMIICFFAEMQRMSHCYKVIVHRAYCMDTEYTIWTLLFKKNVPLGIYRDFDLPRFFKHHNFNLLTRCSVRLHIRFTVKIDDSQHCYESNSIKSEYNVNLYIESAVCLRGHITWHWRLIIECDVSVCCVVIGQFLSA